MYEEVKGIIVEAINCDAEDITPEALLIEDLDMDSLDALELGNAIEDALGVIIPDDKLPELKTVNDVVVYVEANKK